MIICQKPVIFLETISMLYNYVNKISYSDMLRQIQRRFAQHIVDRDGKFLVQLAEALERVSGQVCGDLDGQNPRLNYFFRTFSGMSSSSSCCLAHVMLLGYYVCSEDNLDHYREELRKYYLESKDKRLRIEGIDSFGLIWSVADPGDDLPPLSQQLRRLPCAPENRRQIQEVFSGYEALLEELTELIRPVAERLQQNLQELQRLTARCVSEWVLYFGNQTVESFVRDMFDSTLLFPAESDDIQIGIWLFNCKSVQIHRIKGERGSVQSILIGSMVLPEMSAKNRSKLDRDMICGILRTMGSPDKLEVLHRCAQAPTYAQKLAKEMNMNSGTVSRILYNLNEWGFLEKELMDGRIHYRTKLDAVEELWKSLLAYLAEPEQQ